MAEMFAFANPLPEASISVGFMNGPALQIVLCVSIQEQSLRMNRISGKAIGIGEVGTGHRIRSAKASSAGHTEEKGANSSPAGN